jgi:hypothetical protein
MCRTSLAYRILRQTHNGTGRSRVTGWGTEAAD